MRILIVDQGEIFGGAEFFTLDLVRSIPKNEYDVHVAYAETADPRFVDALKDIPYIKTYAFPLPKLKPLTTSSLWKYIKAFFILKKYIRKEKIEMLHSNTVRTHLLLSPIAKTLKLPLVWVMHDFTFPEKYLKKLAKVPSAIVCVSEQVQRFLFEKAGTEAGRKSIVIPNGIETPKNVPEKPAMLTDHYGKSFQFNTKKRYVGILALIDTWKGQDVFLRAVEILNQDYPQHDDVEYVIIGDATKGDAEKQSYFSDLETFTTQKNLKNVHFLGRQRPADTLPYLSVLVHASIKPEPFGRTIIEAFAYGVPVVASRIGAPEEIVEYGQTGLLSEPKNPQDLAQKISLLLEDHHLAETLKMNGKKEVRAKYELSRVVDGVLQLWERATNGVKKA